MRTTIDIDEALLARAKQLAAKDRRTLSAVLNAALAAFLGSRRGANKDAPFELIVRGRPSARFPTPAEIAETETDEEITALKLRRRSGRAAP